MAIILRKGSKEPEKAIEAGFDKDKDLWFVYEGDVKMVMFKKEVLQAAAMVLGMEKDALVELYEEEFKDKK